MRIAIIGGGASGIYTALLLKQGHPEYEIHIFEKEKKLGRKLCATGNGRCNLLNVDLKGDKYNHPKFMEEAIQAHPFEYLVSAIRSFGIPVRHEGDNVYPESCSAVAYTDFLIASLQRFGVVIHLGCLVTDYVQKGSQYRILNLSCMDFGFFDKVVFTVGGASTPNLGSDGGTFPLLRKHGYDIVPLRPGLCPIQIKNPKDVKPLSGLRRKVIVKAIAGTHVLFRERGEVLFKDNGLSGIVIFNLESVLVRLGVLALSTIHLDFFPDQPESVLLADLSAFHKLNPINFLDGYFPKPLVSFFYKINHIKQTDLSTTQLKVLAHSMKDLVFVPASPYPFANSQVSLGGVSLGDVGSGLESKREKGVFFAGEVLDIDGLCGGYNLSWALISSIAVSEKIGK
jgi:predicted Rossmann fold flavoprotein